MRVREKEGEMARKKSMSFKAKFVEAVVRIEEIGKERNGAVIFTSNLELTCPLCNTKIVAGVWHSCSNWEVNPT